MRFRFALACYISWHVSVVISEESVLCVRGKSFEPGREFLQTRQLKFRTDGPLLGELVAVVASRAVREKLWRDLKPDEIHVTPFDPQLCGSEPSAEIDVYFTPEDITAIQAERSRGPSDQPRLNAIARESSGQPAPIKAPPEGTSPEARRYDWMHIYYATTRQPSGTSTSSTAFRSVRSDFLSFGAVDVSIPADHRLAKLESPSVLRLEWDATPQRHVTLAETYTSFTKATWQAELARKASAFDKGGVLLFIHGFNNSFTEAAQRAAQLAYDLAFPGPTVLFSWPSDGDVLTYTRDEEKAKTAWRHMADVLDDLTRLGKGVPVYVIAHSMGNRIFTQGLAELLRRRPGADRSFRQVILASPDIGVEEFRQRWVNELNSANGPRFTLYASKQDIPVAVSAWLHGEPRLGSGGPNIAVLPPLESIDASAITKEWFGLSHSYFGDNSTVMSDLFLVIHQGLEASQRPRLKKIQGSQGVYWRFKE